MNGNKRKQALWILLGLCLAIPAVMAEDPAAIPVTIKDHRFSPAEIHVKAGQPALTVVCAVAVLREGSEIVLFLYSIAASGRTSVPAMAAGGALGLSVGAGLAALMYLGLVTVPARHLFRVASGLITLLAAGLAAQAVALVQQAGYFEVLTTTVWDSSWLLGDESLGGRLVHTLIGYTARPNGAQLAAYAVTMAVMAALTRPWRRPGAAPSPVPAGRRWW